MPEKAEREEDAPLYTVNVRADALAARTTREEITSLIAILVLDEEQEQTSVEHRDTG